VTSIKLAARLRDVSGGLERLLGTLRRRAVPIEQLSVSRPTPDTLEVVMVLSDAGITPARVVAELCQLQDVQSVARVDGPLASESRELALARLRRPGTSWPPAVERLIRRQHHQAESDTHGQVVELTGTPDEIDEALQVMKDSGALTSASRSGEMLPPEHPTIEP